MRPLAFRACAILAAELGASVVLTGRRSDALDETWRRMENRDAHIIVPGDIASPEFIKELADSAGKMDGLVHAAGVCPAVPVGMIDSVALLESIKINYFAFGANENLLSKNTRMRGFSSKPSRLSLRKSVGRWCIVFAAKVRSARLFAHLIGACAQA